MSPSNAFAKLDEMRQAWIERHEEWLATLSIDEQIMQRQRDREWVEVNRRVTAAMMQAYTRGYGYLRVQQPDVPA